MSIFTLSNVQHPGRGYFQIVQITQALESQGPYQGLGQGPVNQHIVILGKNLEPNLAWTKIATGFISIALDRNTVWLWFK